MHFLKILLIFLLFISCKDISNKEKVSKPKLIQEVVKAEKKIVEKEFTLDDKNAIPFLFKYGKKNKENKVRISTSYGNIDVLLFENTPYHRANFIYLTKKKYFDNTQFYRVINNFIIQGGNSDDKITLDKRKKIGRYLLPNDNKKGFKHNRGMVSMPSSAVQNPYKMASPYEFFIVQQKGGAHHLDGDYAVFGKVISGMDVVDKIASMPTDNGDWPEKNININKIEIIN